MAMVNKAVITFSSSAIFQRLSVRSSSFNWSDRSGVGTPQRLTVYGREKFSDHFNCSSFNDMVLSPSRCADFFPPLITAFLYMEVIFTERFCDFCLEFFKPLKSIFEETRKKKIR